MNSPRGRIPILWLLSGAALIPLVTLGTLLLWIATRSTARSADALGGQVIAAGVGRVEDALTQYLDRAVRESDILASLLEAGTIDRGDIRVWRQRLFAHLSANPEIASIGFVNADREYAYLCRFPGALEYAVATHADVAHDPTTIVACAATFERGVDDATAQRFAFDVRTRPWYTLALASPGPAWTPVYEWSSGERTRPARERGVAYTRMIRGTTDGSGGEPAGVLSIDLSLSRVGAFLDGVARPMHAFMFIDDASGERIGQSMGDGSAGGFASGPAIERAIAAHRDRLGRDALRDASDPAAAPRLLIDGQRYWAREVELRASPTTRWYLTLAIPEQPILGEARADTRRIVAIGVTCLIVTALATALAARLLSTPVRRLAEFARGVGAGRFGERIDVGVSREIAALSSSLNAMAASLQDRVTLLAQRDAAEEAGALKARVVAHVSHEFRTPLNAILNYGELLQEAAARAGRPVEARDAENILTAGRHLLRLVDDLLDLSRLEAGRLRLDVATFSLDTLLDELLVTVRPGIERNANRLVVDPPPPGVRVRSDPARLKQVLLNLLANAGKFTRGGEVRLAVKRADECVVFRVADTGPGIAAGELGRIFEPFTQAAHAGEGYREGAGLGLAIAGQLCQALGGTIAVASEPGEGTCFTVRVPHLLPDVPDLRVNAAAPHVSTSDGRRNSTAATPGFGPSGRSVSS